MDSMGVAAVAGVQKNMRLSEQGAELLRALKCDLEASDGEVVADSLERKALEGLRYHVARIKRVRLGMADEAEMARSGAAMTALLAGLNCEGERFQIEVGRVQTRLAGQGEWRAGSGFPLFTAAVQAVVLRAVELAREFSLEEATVAVLLLAACEHPDGARDWGCRCGSWQANSVRLRSDAARWGPRRRSPSPWRRSRVLVEGCVRLAVLEGVGGVVDILVAALQRPDPDVTQIVRALDIRPEAVRARLMYGDDAAADSLPLGWAGPPPCAASLATHRERRPPMCDTACPGCGATVPDGPGALHPSIPAALDTAFFGIADTPPRAAWPPRRRGR